MLNLNRPISFWLAGLLLGFPSFALAATVANVNVGDDYFSPSTVTISVNDQVKWTWIGSQSHSSTSDSGLWDSGIQGNAYVFSKTFSAAGSFPYHCTIHPFMVGSVTVKSLGLNVALINPSNGAVLSAPASFILKATASSPGGAITNVQFFRGTNFLGSVTSPPYAVPVLNLAVGNYTFSARAADSLGHKATNSIVVHVVPDVIKPTVAILSPAALQRVTNSVT